MSKCLVIHAGGHAYHYIGGERSSCFYNAPFDLSAQATKLLAEGKKIVAWSGRVEVSDEQSDLHRHLGTTIAHVVAGTGVFKSPEGEVAVQAGDTIIVPPMTPHLSVATKHTTMIEVITYIGDVDDMQASLQA